MIQQGRLLERLGVVTQCCDVMSRGDLCNVLLLLRCQTALKLMTLTDSHD